MCIFCTYRHNIHIWMYIHHTSMYYRCNIHPTYSCKYTSHRCIEKYYTAEQTSKHLRLCASGWTGNVRALRFLDRLMGCMQCMRDGNSWFTSTKKWCFLKYETWGISGCKSQRNWISPGKLWVFDPFWRPQWRQKKVMGRYFCCFWGKILHFAGNGCPACPAAALAGDATSFFMLYMRQDSFSNPDPFRYPRF